MRTKFAALIVLLLLGVPITANALETDELIALTAMPLVVAAAAELTDVPTSELMNLVGTLNNANVPPTQFVEVVRYAPVAIVSPAEPRFTTYVTTEYGRGVGGKTLAYEIADAYPTYGVEEVHIVDPPVVTYVERQTILPQYVVTRFEPQPIDPVALVAMPLAVAAVADVANVPTSDLMNFITLLNRARVPPAQFVEIVRYSPTMLLDDVQRPLFLRTVTTEIDRGVIGRPLAFALADRIGIDDIDNVDFVRSSPAVIEPVITTRVARTHPHGGPPGQLKKELGLQTGAEVVHGYKPGRSSKPHSVARSRVVRPSRETTKVRHEKKVHQPPVRVEHGPAVMRPVMKQPHVSKGHGGAGGNKGNGGGNAGGNKGGGGGGGGKGKGRGKG